MARKRTLPPRVHHSRGWHFHVITVAGKATWTKLGKAGKLGPGYLTAESMARLEALQRAGDRSGMQVLFDRYEAEALPQKAAKTQVEQRRQLVTLRERFGEAEPHEIRTVHIAEYLDQGIADARAVAANREVALLSDVFARGIRWGIAEANPCTGVRRNKEKPRDRAVTNVEFWAIHARAIEPLQHAMELAVLTGQRREDLLQATQASITPDGLAFRQGKTGKRLLVRITEPLAALLERCKARAVAEYSTLQDPPLIVARGGQRYTTGGFGTQWQKLMHAAGQAGLKRFTFHDLRSLSADLHATGDHLGHANPATTRRVYNRRPRKVDPADMQGGS